MLSLASEPKDTKPNVSRTSCFVPVISPSSSTTTMCISSLAAPLEAAFAEVPGALSNKSKNSHLLSTASLSTTAVVSPVPAGWSNA